jgi:protein SCO1/2
LLVDHEEIPGFMPAMTMEFHVAPGDLAIAAEGVRIRAVLHPREGGYFLDHIWPVDPAKEAIVENAQRTLRQDTVIRGSGAYRAIGENLPDFALYDQTGSVASASRFQGRQLVVNFIFTRCPDAEMCPASTAKMMQLQSQARDRGVDDLELISITLDPEYDTPGVLNDYARIRGIDTTNFTFLTGPEGAIKDLMAQLGVLAFKDGPLIKHTLSTVLIAGDGRIVFREDGSKWRVSNFVDRLHAPVSDSD